MLKSGRRVGMTKQDDRSTSTTTKVVKNDEPDERSSKYKKKVADKYPSYEYLPATICRPNWRY